MEEQGVYKGGGRIMHLSHCAERTAYSQQEIAEAPRLSCNTVRTGRLDDASASDKLESLTVQLHSLLRRKNGLERLIVEQQVCNLMLRCIACFACHDPLECFASEAKWRFVAPLP
jgi:hypothetical protein